MADISLSKAVRSNLLALKGTADMMAVAQNRLSTGNEVNSALDNPSNWFTAAGLSNRSSDLNALMDSMANGIQTLKAADNGLSAMTKTLESMQSTLRQARQDKSFSTESLPLAKINANDPALGKLTLSGGAVANAVDIALVKTAKGDSKAMDASYAAPAPAAKASYQADSGMGALSPAEASGAIDLSLQFADGPVLPISIAPAARTTAELRDVVQALVDASPAYAGKIDFKESPAGHYKFETTGTIDGAFVIGGTTHDRMFGDSVIPTQVPLAVTGSNGTHDFTVNGHKIRLDTTTGTDLDTAIASVNAQLGDDRTFEAYRELGGKLALRAIADNAGALQIGGADAGLFGTPANGVVAGTNGDLIFARSVDEMVNAVNASAELQGKVRASNDSGKLRLENQSTTDLVIEGKNATSGKLDGTAGTSTVKGNAVRTGLAEQFNELRDQLDKLADDASFNGVNLMRGDNLTITFNETGTSVIDIRTEDGQAINASSLGVPTSLQASQLDNDTAIDGLLGDMTAALNMVRAQASTFGSNLSIVQNRQDFTKAMIDTLKTGAGNLTLADMNAEAATLLALQTRQQLSSNSLSLASQADQSVLQVLR
jgi:flagellin-like hook-associated protein FlgL